MRSWEGTPLRNDDEAKDPLDPRAYYLPLKLSSRCNRKKGGGMLGDERQTQKHTASHIHTKTHPHTRTPTNKHTHTHEYTQKNTHTHTHTHTHSNSHTHTHKHT